MINNIRFKNIKFLNISDKDFPIIIKKKGLFLFPSGPGLSNLDKKPTYLKALHNADFNFFDSDLEVRLLVESTAQPSYRRVGWHSVQNK